MLFVVVGLNWAAIHFGFVTLPPNSVPWEPPKLAAPPGFFAHAQIQRLLHDKAMCLAALERAPGLSYTPQPDMTADTGCGYDDVVLATRTPIAFNAAPLSTCALASALYWWQAALKGIAAAQLHTTITRIDQAGTYECRNVNSAATGPRSEHATANAIDVEAFDTADGRHITVAKDWGKPTDEGRFLRAAHDSACTVFGEVLGPDYNSLHATHSTSTRRTGRFAGSRARHQTPIFVIPGAGPAMTKVFRS